MTDYYNLIPDASNPDQAVAFGTSGHRGSASKTAFNENHIAAISQAIVEYRDTQGITGPIYIAWTATPCRKPPTPPPLKSLPATV